VNYTWDLLIVTALFFCLSASIDCGKSQDYIAHTTILGNGLYAMENLTSEIFRLPPKDSILMVMPLKITGGSGSPARVIAFVPK
jgi:kynurenine formamidase